MSDHEVVIVGSGFGGMAALRMLRAMGIDDVVILERRPFLGGTWHQNTYPGAAVDVQSALYSMSGEPWDWSRMFAGADELRAYTDHLIEVLGVDAVTEREADVVEARWEEGTCRWRVETRDGRVFHARHVINASGPLSRPSVPDFEGRETFEGPSFHTNAWDHTVDLAGLRVAVIGTGASAAQVIPAIAESVGHLHVFQRTPHWVRPRPDRVFSPLQRRLLRHPLVHGALRAAIYWGLESRVVGFKYSRTLLRWIGERPARRLLAEQVADPVLRDRLTPDYEVGCKRVLLSNTLYPALCRSDVTLHPREQGVQRITPTGIETMEGEHIELDAIVYATGFDVEGGAGFRIVGRGGGTLREAWSEYARAYVGTTVPRFPNLYLLLGPNSGIGHTSALVMMEAQLRYVRSCLQTLSDRNALAIEPTEEAESSWTRWIHEQMAGTVWENGGCQSWYKTDAGRVTAMFPGFSFTYRRATRRCRLEDHVLTSGGENRE